MSTQMATQVAFVIYYLYEGMDVYRLLLFDFLNGKYKPIESAYRIKIDPGDWWGKPDHSVVRERSLLQVVRADRDKIEDSIYFVYGPSAKVKFLFAEEARSFTPDKRAQLKNWGFTTTFHLDKEGIVSEHAQKEFLPAFYELTSAQRISAFPELSLHLFLGRAIASTSNFEEAKKVSEVEKMYGKYEVFTFERNERDGGVIAFLGRTAVFLHRNWVCEFCKMAGVYSVAGLVGKSFFVNLLEKDKCYYAFPIRFIP